MAMQRTKGFSLALTAGAAAALLLLTGCSTSTSSATNSPSANTDGVSTAAGLVDQYSQVVESFTPSDAVPGASTALKGKKVMYIPAVAAVPYFATSFKATQAAFSAVGMKAQLCDAQANPSSLSSCFTQVTTQGYAAVVIDSIDPSIAIEGFKAVAATGIPVIVLNVPVPAKSPTNVSGFGVDSVLQQRLSSAAIISDSKGTASVVGVRVIDHDGTKAWWDYGAAATYKELCPNCKLSVVETKTTDLQNLPAKVSAALLASPDAMYLQPELGPETIPTLQGGTDAGRTDLKATVASATLSDLQQLASGTGLKWAVTHDLVRLQWLSADMVIRSLSKVAFDATKYVINSRIFTPENVKGLDVTQAGWDDSNWFGGNDYQTTLKGLWK